MIIHGTHPVIQKASFKMRAEVFVKEQGIPAQLEFDEKPGEVFRYFLVVEDGLVIATARYQVKNQLLNPDRFCVKKNFRNQGVGEKLLQSLEKYGANHGLLAGFLNSEVDARPFYEHSGWQVVGELFYEDTIPVWRMEKILKKLDEKKP
ncbi:GNAT family N-acetyltransferase [Enterococcus timonensis]|uniref:GNAT family N-acetyltransferase n=1 Tax=Enterococcus timonensis TaxID=1852364 RepID=UPI0008DA314C|nr:GNAT family N-acetyltransferase [Enterococcus timonensis]